MAADGSSITYQIPPQAASTGSIDWGYSHQGVHQSGWYVELVFEPDVVYLEGSAVAVPASLAGYSIENANMDMNHDGDQLDLLVSGIILKRIYDNLGALQDQSYASASAMLMASGALLNGDINGDAIFDSLFTVLDSAGGTVLPANIAASGAKLRVNVCHGSYTESKKDFVLRQLRDEWNFRNTQ